MDGWDGEKWREGGGMKITLRNSEIGKIPDHFADQVAGGSQLIESFEILFHEQDVVILSPHYRRILQIDKNAIRNSQILQNPEIEFLKIEKSK